jgi:hypothetical protein
MVKAKDLAVGVAAAGGVAALGYYLVKKVAPPPAGAVPGRISTRMVVTVPPPSSVAPGQDFAFSGYLEDANGNRLPSKTVNLVVDGSVANTVTTGADGAWNFTVRLDKTAVVYAEFPGDDAYEGC